MEHLRTRIRNGTAFLIVGLVLSGATAIPIPTQLEIGIDALGEELDAGGRLPAFVGAWLRTLRDGIRSTAERAPFMFYGTDWLAFGHFMIALAFVGALRDPVRNRWLYKFGMIACALVPVWALAFGQIRAIPPWWRAIDAMFGVVGFVPCWLCHRWTGALEDATVEPIRPGADRVPETQGPPRDSKVRPTPAGECSSYRVAEADEWK